MKDNNRSDDERRDVMQKKSEIEKMARMAKDKICNFFVLSITFLKDVLSIFEFATTLNSNTCVLKKDKQKYRKLYMTKLFTNIASNITSQYAVVTDATCMRVY